MGIQLNNCDDCAERLERLLSLVPDYNIQYENDAMVRQSMLTKPDGSLGALEQLSARLAGITELETPEFIHPHVFIFAADHGVAKTQRVSAYPQSVTNEMVLNFARGGAVVNALANHIGATLHVVDVGVDCEKHCSPRVVTDKVRNGTDDWSTGPAMTSLDAISAMEAGANAVLTSDPLDLVVVGEMGIGNTATAAVLIAATTSVPSKLLVGPGTGLDVNGIAVKLQVIERGLARRDGTEDVFTLLYEFGGLEIAAMVGAIIAATSRRSPVILDGLISTLSGFLACLMNPKVRNYLIAGHLSPEPAHAVILERMSLVPLLDLGLRLGEASGATLAVPLVTAAAAILKNVSTFEQAGISTKS